MMSIVFSLSGFAPFVIGEGFGGECAPQVQLKAFFVFQRLLTVIRLAV